VTINLMDAPATTAEQGPPAAAEPAAVEVRHGFAVIALLAGLVGAAAFVVPTGPARLVMLLAFLLVGPGAAVMSYPRIADRLVSWALTVTASLSIACGIAVLMLWTHTWNPGAAVLALAGAVVGTAFARLMPLRRQARIWPADALRIVLRNPSGAQPPDPPADISDTPAWRRRTAAALPIVSMVAAAGLWVLSLVLFQPSTVDGYGLTAAIGVPFVAAILLVCLGFAGELFGRARRSVLTGGLLLVSAVLHATVPLEFRTLEYAWTYKHIGVVDLIRDNGHLLDSHDIYQMWPGFFATMAMPSSIAGVDSLAFAAWSSLAFGLINVLLVAGLLRQLTTDRRVIALSAAIFTICMWVDTGYFSPQAFVYSLMLGFWLIVTRWLMTAPPVPAPDAGRISRARAILVRGLPLTQTHDRRTRVFAGIAATAVLAAITASHQLSPFLMMIPATVLVVLGVIRPKSLLVVWGVVIIAFVAPRMPSVAEQYGLFEFDVLANTAGNAKSWATPAQEFSALVARALALSVWMLAVLAVWPARRKLGAVLVPVVLGFAPFAALAGQSYGGEAIYRVYAFSLPFAALLISGFWLRTRGAIMALATGAVLAVATVASLQGLQGQLLVHRVPVADIRAAQYFYANAEPGSTLVLLARNFPTRLDANYGDFNRGRAMDVALIDDPFFVNRLDGAQLPTVEQYIHNLGTRVNYLVVSRQMTVYTDYFGFLPAGATASLDAALSASVNWQVFYQGSGVTIYRLNP
jgi:hypothetical protein